ncbi:MAG: restriction endonuclease subunit S [Akkermansia muciniphila]|jgi:type I restriction enzyme S subunit|uniref:restriction endonuclease subunit S n=1 Tax=Akkermansia TaxID=239934 RepID=UPI001C05FAF9|nr:MULTISPECIES: restriction endonuclease subunit S [Akkermansia]MCI9205012.1 restriction endonuclease subunit S [Akkermansia muciniphila]QWO99999.1 restriction endonuclease subunit S [Akkermansia muciniphila]QWP43208.1 restriction endonuclease subunit S [Akkermansia muciniphila]WMB21490.1 restriction endonuclease subunit S [Akkermansia muciniphila]
MCEMRESGVEWLAEIPTTWDLVQLGSLFSEHKHKNAGLQSENLLSLSYGNIIRKDINTSDGLLPESFEGYNVIDDGDIVLRLTDLQNDQRSLRVGLSHERGIVTSAYVTLRKRSEAINSKFYYYLIHSYDVRKGFYGMGAGVRQGLNYAGCKKIMLTLPPTDEQESIVAVLDEKTAKVDALIANVQAQIEKLKAYKQSLITEVVTKGLDPSVPMKDSGVEWIGNIPQHWNIARIKNVATILRGASPRPIDDYLVAPGTGENWIKIGDTVKGHKNITQTAQQVSHEGADKSRRVHKGDLILTNSMSFGEPYILAIDGCIHDGWLALTSLRDVSEDYMYYFLQSSFCYLQFKQQVAGGIVQNLNSEKVASCTIFCPPGDEQFAIIEHLNYKCSQIERLVAIKEAKIEKLEQYRRTLIYEYVTGKKEVP